MLLAAQESFALAKREKEDARLINNDPVDPTDNDSGNHPSTDESNTSDVVVESTETQVNPHPPGWMFQREEQDSVKKPEVEEEHVPEPESVEPPQPEPEIVNEVQDETKTLVDANEEAKDYPPDNGPLTDNQIEQLKETLADPDKLAKVLFKRDHPDDTLKRHKDAFANGEINQLPWEQYKQGINIRDHQPDYGFGIAFPKDPNKGDVFIRVDSMPSRVFKWNGDRWLSVDKEVSSSYTYNEQYIEHLINKIASGEYDPELLTEDEKDLIEQQLKK